MVIGAGIIGVCSALELQKRGFQVTLVEADRPAAGASEGNCGLLAVGSVVPFSKPGTFKKVPGWLLNKNGPLSIRWNYFPKLIPWFLEFLKASRASRIQEISQGLAALTEHAFDAYEPWLEEAGIKDLLKPHETLIVYETEQEYRDDVANLQIEKDLGFDYEELSKSRLRELEPSLSDQFACGVRLKGWYYFADPKRLVTSLYDLFVRKGGTVVTGTVTSINVENGRATSVNFCGQPPESFDNVVVAAGVWSRKLADKLGDKLPVEALAGYSTTVSDPGIEVKHAITYAAGGFVITPMESGLRIGGTIEMGGVDSKPDFGRAKVIAEKAKRVFNGLKNVSGTEWMGYRSFMPDTLPVIDRASSASNVFYAFGHGQIGITTGAITGRLVAEMVGREQTSIGLAPYSARRFKD
ncbi:FAD dependent oxidoreductase [Marinobacter santoriniensis NKSG1]|uniref:FAD dependent oxidoreductase n=1 Tax=Marinobacter santoriniensis NKSG1 TaxID=1288826 RepID=M7DH08_9GAMM|nr:FAD dependent oxidoreductase [Marinobacter santoriniensis NKSG1]